MISSRINIEGIQITKTNLKETVKYLSEYNYSNPGYICLPDLSVLVAAQKDTVLKKILNQSLLTLPDGKSLEFIARLKGEKNISTISGYWLIRNLLHTKIKHYFYGGSLKCIQLIEKKFQNDYSDSIILGYSSPPALTLNEIANNPAINNDIQAINQLRPDIIWVGISSPKQDYLIYEYHKILNRGLMIGVGGVFDYLAGTKKISPEWIKRIGLRWLFRLGQEPRRLWKRYLFTFLDLLKLEIKKTTAILLKRK